MTTKWIFGILKIHVANIVAAAQLEKTHREIRELEQESCQNTTISVPFVSK